MHNSEQSLAALLDDPRRASRLLDCADARESLSDFCGLIAIPGAPVDEDEDAESVLFRSVEGPSAAHHKLLIEKLEAVERGDIRRLMVFMPPGSAKSTYASVVFPVWFMGRKKRRNVIVATYASDLARKIGRRARSILKQPAYRDVFDTGLSADSAAADEWALDNENEFMGGGILSGITGNRADLIVIDDPIKGREDADSDTIRAKTKSEYEDSIKTRGKPGYRIVLIQTRWHEDDLAGSILPEDWDGDSGPILCRDGDVWEVLSLPAQARRNDPLGRTEGQYLWPEWFDEDHWRTFKLNPRTWSALYQQTPAPDAGSYFMKAWFDGGTTGEGAAQRTYECNRYHPQDLPRSLRCYGASDYAVTEDGGDYTTHRVWGVDTRMDLWLLAGGYRAQASSDQWIDALIALMALHRPFAWFGEAGVIQKAIEPALLRRMKERQVMCRLEWLASIHDKPTRARGFQARAAMGTVHVPYGPEGDAFVQELTRFPAGRHDDDVDNASLIGRALDMAHPAIAKPDPPKTPRPSMQASVEDMLRRQAQLDRQTRRL